MKKLLALALVALMLLASAACAESLSTTLSFSDLVLTRVEGDEAREIPLPELTAEGAIGMSGLVPSIEMTFMFGDADQELGAVLQLVGTDLLGALGSISTTFCLSLEKLTGSPETAQLVAAGIGSTISLGGISLAGMINMLTAEGENGERVVALDIPTARLVAATERALDKAKGLEAANRVDFEAIRARLESLGETVRLEIRFDPASGAFTAAVSDGPRALRLSGVMKLASAPFVYADVDPTAERVDVTNLTDEDIARLNDEASLLFGRLINMAAAMGLEGFIPQA